MGSNQNEEATSSCEKKSDPTQKKEGNSEQEKDSATKGSLPEKEPPAGGSPITADDTVTGAASAPTEIEESSKLFSKTTNFQTGKKSLRLKGTLPSSSEEEKLFSKPAVSNSQTKS